MVTFFFPCTGDLKQNNRFLMILQLGHNQILIKYIFWDKFHLYVKEK